MEQVDFPFVTDDLGRDYPALLETVRHGRVVDSRIGPCAEVTGAHVILRQPMKCVVDRDGFSMAFMGEEIAQLLAGKHDNDRLRAVTPLAADLITPLTAYGPRTWMQLQEVEAELKRDPLSRRAIVYIGRDDDLLHANDAERAAEMPCTALWNFLIRDEHLHMYVHMRSWDAVWGLCYDIPSFVAVQAALAKATGTSMGIYAHHAMSLHAYDKHAHIQARPNTNSILPLTYLGTTMAQTQAYYQAHLRG